MSTHPMANTTAQESKCTTYEVLKSCSIFPQKPEVNYCGSFNLEPKVTKEKKKERVTAKPKKVAKTRKKLESMKYKTKRN